MTKYDNAGPIFPPEPISGSVSFPPTPVRLFTTPRPTVYLAGPINGLAYDEAMAHRATITRALSPDIEVLSPMRWKQMLVGQSRLGSKGPLYQHPLTAAPGIVARDRFDVMRCDLMLADFTNTAGDRAWYPYSAPEEFTDPDDPTGDVLSSGEFFSQYVEAASIGTCVEFGWADAFRKPVVTILPTGNIHDHPFVRQLSGFVVATTAEAVEIIRAVLLQGPPA